MLHPTRLRLVLPLLGFSLLALPLVAQPATSAPAAPAVVAPAPEVIEVKPVAVYLTWQRDPVTTMTVHWHTDWTHGFADSVLEYRALGAAEWRRGQGEARAMPFSNRMVHTVELTGLNGDTVYEFRFGQLRARQPDGALEFFPHEPVRKFRTLPATLSRPVRFVSGGDAYGGNTLNLFADMCRAAAAHDPEFALMGGDIAYVNNEPRAIGRWFSFFDTWGETMVRSDGCLVPIVPAIGNHEVHGDAFAIRGGSPARGVSPDRAIQFFSLFSFPGRPGYNVLDVGDYLSLIALDTFHANPVPGPQTDWLRTTLAQRRSVPYVIPFYHVPAYPSHRSFAGTVSVAVRANWVPLFDEAGVRFAFENHDHTYKVTQPLRAGQPHPQGTRYLGDGAWAVSTRETTPPAQAPYLERAYSRNHVFIATLERERAHLRAIDPKGEVFDEFSIPVRP